jgi:hypothetical protein
VAGARTRSRWTRTSMAWAASQEILKISSIAWPIAPVARKVGRMT